MTDKEIEREQNFAKKSAYFKKRVKDYFANYENKSGGEDCIEICLIREGYRNVLKAEEEIKRQQLEIERLTLEIAGMEGALRMIGITVGLEVVHRAIEKQIPKKPNLDIIFPSGVKWWLCPACGHNNIETNDKFCHECGQALDWSETE